MMYNVFRHGSKRLGARNYPQAGNTVQLDNVTQNNTQGYSSRELFRKQYELSDHLGNVRAVISDAKWSYYGIMTPHIISYTNYYPFGMAQTGRNWSSSGYRFGIKVKKRMMKSKVVGIVITLNLGCMTQG